MSRLSPKRNLCHIASLATGILVSSASLAVDVTLVWDAVAGSAGYELHYGTTPGNYDAVVNAGNTPRLTVTGLEAGEIYYAAVRAYRDGLSDFSAFSNELQVAVADAPGPAPVASFTASPATGEAPLVATFTDTSSGSAGTRLWRFPGGATSSSGTVAHTFASAGQYSVTLTITAADGRVSVATRTVNVTAPVEPTPPDPSDDIPMATATFEADDRWQTIEFARTFNDPVVVLGPPVGSDVTATVRVMNVSGTGFDVRLTALDADETDSAAMVSYVVVERGEYDLADGRKLVANHFTGITGAATIWRVSRHSFSTSFDAPPVVVTSLGSSADPQWRVLRLNKVGGSGFDYRIDTPEASRYARAVERVDYIAMDAGSGRFGNLQYLAGVTAEAVTDMDYALVFDSPMQGVPHFLANTVTTKGTDTGVINATALDDLGANVYFGEERSLDDEVVHTFEAVAYLAIGTTSTGSEAPAVAAEYLFEGDADDTGGRGQDLTLGRGARIGSGRGGQVLALDGVDDYAVLLDSEHVGAMPSSSSEPASDFSVTAWIRPNVVGNWRKPIASKQGALVGDGPTRGFVFTTGEASSSGKLFFQVYSSESTKTQISGGPKVQTGVWQHVAATYEFRGHGQSRMRIYLNGVRVGKSDTAVGPAQPNAQSLYIGAYRWNNSYRRFFNGMMDDVRVHRRTLTSAEVKALAEQ